MEVSEPELSQERRGSFRLSQGWLSARGPGQLLRKAVLYLPLYSRQRSVARGRRERTACGRSWLGLKSGTWGCCTVLPTITLLKSVGL